jgi:Na+/H+ antiporter NhaD/arsenite permease-like protein
LRRPWVILKRQADAINEPDRYVASSIERRFIMTQKLAEMLILVPSTLCTGFLLFIAGVVQKVMNGLDEATFQRFLNLLVHNAERSPYAITVSTVPFVGAIPYFIYYRLSNLWFSAGLVLFTVASIVSKILVLPIYKRVPELDSQDTAQLAEERRKLQNANRIRAGIQAVSTVLMVIGLAKSPVPEDADLS